MPEIGKINIDFQVLKTYDPKVLLIADSSDWKHIKEKLAVLEVTLPGARKSCEFPFDKEKINILNSSVLGLTEKACSQEDLVQLPDGIYNLKLKGSPDSFFKERKYLRTERLQIELDKLYISLGFDKGDRDLNELRKNLLFIDFILKSADSATRQDDIAKAKWYFNEAVSLIENYRDCVYC